MTRTTWRCPRCGDEVTCVGTPDSTEVAHKCPQRKRGDARLIRYEPTKDNDR